MNGETGSPSERHLVPPASEERRRQWIERRARRDWKRRLRAHIVSGLTDDILRDLLIRPAEERDEHRNILDMEIVRQYVPLEFEGRSVPDVDAPRELTWATEDAVKRRLRGIESIYGYTRSEPYNRTSRLVALWYGEEPVLPEFLKDVLYFELRLGNDPSNIRLDSSCKVYPVDSPSISNVTQPIRSFGSLGFLALLEHRVHSKIPVRHVGVTVGHVVDDGTEDTIELETDDQMCPVQLQVAPNFERQGRRRPAFRHSWARPRECFDEICLLETNTLSDELVALYHVSDAIDCNALFSLPSGIDPVGSLTVPALLDIDDVYDSLIEMLPLEVHKFGAGTGQTTGTLVDIQDLEDDDTYSTQAVRDDTQAFKLKIEWLSPDEPFAQDGDSGSLVYARHHGKTVPLGIHYGSDEGLRVSYSYLLWSWCEEIDNKLDLRLTFCSPGRCRYQSSSS
ncbi:hypothetical protein ANOM_010331 [Aspergillus nomiae NRRL 13137]|uniref:Uncharacterized protein n=1 Tax=Aspergillus nomiae NRRL (strain ATCC 15546 / NRRL 13137 / CBS 260.88 / M93) TaxID=1509407 RepID=A0A0L1IPF6_ASPN3|nr:uncharacterized protein ANOM_010331 [Aspergillus nomiae NRRL 13137]KNG81215.1 hypothetical protein ANOM_010331 [Aspergillus nomiae NRRL 13137]